ncbi:hypothetical protein RKE29_10315, partial [Streptomyces sp. B1866]|nr:hypothetical protein [Streptomyces sp. B1866]
MSTSRHLVNRQRRLAALSDVREAPADPGHKTKPRKPEPKAEPRREPRAGQAKDARPAKEPRPAARPAAARDGGRT